MEHRAIERKAAPQGPRRALAAGSVLLGLAGVAALALAVLRSGSANGWLTRWTADGVPETLGNTAEVVVAVLAISITVSP